MFPIRDHNPSGTTPVVTFALILANVLVFAFSNDMLLSDSALSRIYYDYAMIPARISAGENYTAFVTSMFLHGGLLHLAGNMLFLWIFGDNLEDQMGHVQFGLFYLTAGIGAGLAQYLAAPWSGVPTIGASGAIAGVMGGYLLFFPRARVDILLFLVVFVRIFPVPAWIMLGLWFAIQLFSGFSTDISQGGVAYWAHAGGFVLGTVLALPFWLHRGATRYWTRNDGQPPHPVAQYPTAMSGVPRVRRRR